MYETRIRIMSWDTDEWNILYVSLLDKNGAENWDSYEPIFKIKDIAPL